MRYESEGGLEYLNDGQWSQIQNLKTIRALNVWKVGELQARRNERSQILKDISHINFIKLSNLYLEENFIDSVEVLSRIRMPYLIRLDLGKNCIRSVKTLRKVNWPSIFQISIVGNKILDQNNLTEGWLPNLKSLTQGQNGEKGEKFLEYTSLLKLESSSMQDISLPISEFSFSNHVKRACQKKWHEIRFNPSFFLQYFNTDNEELQLT